MTFKVGDKVTRINRPFRDMAVGDTGKVTVSTENFICLEGYTVTSDSPFPTKFNPKYFKLASEPCADDTNVATKPATEVKLDNGKLRIELTLDSGKSRTGLVLELVLREKEGE